MNQETEIEIFNENVVFSFFTNTKNHNILIRIIVWQK